MTIEITFTEEGATQYKAKRIGFYGSDKQLTDSMLAAKRRLQAEQPKRCVKISTQEVFDGTVEHAAKIAGFRKKFATRFIKSTNECA